MTVNDLFVLSLTVYLEAHLLLISFLHVMFYAAGLDWPMGLVQYWPSIVLNGVHGQSI